MPEMEQRIAQWRRDLAETTGCNNEVLDELESHLREEIQQLVRTGQTEEQALALATLRLGQPSALAREFAKVAAPANWLPVRVVRFVAVVLAILIVGYLLACSQAVGLLGAAHVGAVALGYTLSLLVGSLAICYVTTRPFRDLSAGQMQELERAVFRLMATAAVLTLAGLLLGCVWAKDHLGRYWGWHPKETWGIGVLVWDLALLLLLAARTWNHRVIPLAILGNIVVAFAWFADIPHHSYGTPPLHKLQMVFGLTQLCLFGVGFLPARRRQQGGDRVARTVPPQQPN